MKKFRLLVSTWKPQSDLWPVNQGPYYLGAASICGSFYITRYYTKKFMLSNLALFTLSVPILYTSSLSGLYNYFRAIPNMVTGRIRCPTCAQIRSGVVQASISTVSTVVFASLGAMFLAIQSKSYPMPPAMLGNSVSRHQTFAIWKRLTKPGLKVFALLGAVNYIFAHYIIYQQQTTYYYLHKHFLDKQYTPKI